MYPKILQRNKIIFISYFKMSFLFSRRHLILIYQLGKKRLFRLTVQGFRANPSHAYNHTTDLDKVI